jgi:hypothetical protein
VVLVTRELDDDRRHQRDSQDPGTIPSDVRHVDWRVGDPAGAPLDEVRRVREDTERRADVLAEELVRRTEEVTTRATS